MSGSHPIREIVIEGATENNLRNVSLRIPHYRLIAVTGVSGSGKTSLVYDVLGAEGRRLFAENFGSGRNLTTLPPRPHAGHIGGLFPVVAIGQDSILRTPRSTVGTLTGLYDLLRLLFARLGTSTGAISRTTQSHFSFNQPDGWCQACKGIGLQDHVDSTLLIGDPTKTIRQGAFVLTTPKPYIIYSQVTMEVLNQVCQAHGFSVDIPWQELTAEQQDVVLNGSDRIKVLFGKHPLESRLNWTGITAKPREEDYYNGILPVMEDILKRDRNPNIMRFARSQTCTACGGLRLNPAALAVRFRDLSIADFARMTLREFHNWFRDVSLTAVEQPVAGPIRAEVLERTSRLIRLGNGHLTIGRESPSLNSGEARRIRLANQAAGNLRNVLYILDEPSAGLHPSEIGNLVGVLQSLVQQGNTVILVDHDEQSIRQADWIIDIGPGAGKEGGKILYNGSAEGFFNGVWEESATWNLLAKPPESNPGNPTDLPEPGPKLFVGAENAVNHNLKNITVRFAEGRLNVISGVSGSGKTSLAAEVIRRMSGKAGGTIFRKVIHLDATPIGRTPNSNPATYTGMSDHIRDLLASLPESRRRGYKKGQFSFVVKGGRCEACGGAGVRQVGMHFLGNVEVPCEVCEGRRFTAETLDIQYEGRNIHDILELTVDEAHAFAGQPKIRTITSLLSGLGLGYLRLGQSSASLSGGEAQRVKLATELARPAGGKTLYVFDEPTTGLHGADVKILLQALRGLTDKGHTVLCIENDPAFILEADRIADMGPGSAAEGGSLVAEGRVSAFLAHPGSITAAGLRAWMQRQQEAGTRATAGCDPKKINAPIRLEGVETNNLKNIDIQIDVDAITAVTGVSGSGKSSLVYGTLFAEAQRRLIEGLPAYSRRFAVKAGLPALRSSTGLVPAIAMRKRNPQRNPRSTVATFTGLYDVYRLLFSRLAKAPDGRPRPLSSAFSFNDGEGACPDCKGLGTRTVCDPDRLITHPGLPLTAGAMDGTRTGRFYGDPFGQYVATLQAVGNRYGIDFTVPFQSLDPKARALALRGAGGENFEVDWKYRRGNREGVHRMTAAWPGFLGHVEAEYARKHADNRGDAMLDLMEVVPCDSCQGTRLKEASRSFLLAGLSIAAVTAYSAEEATDWFTDFFDSRFADESERLVARAFRDPILGRLDAIIRAGLGYIATNRVVGTLSGGEYQRLQLAGLVRSPLAGVLYILDEPSFGLHPKDTDRIAGLVESLHQQGNGVIFTDHSPALIRLATRHITLGPGAGSQGGEVVYTGEQPDPDLHVPAMPGPLIAGQTPGEGLRIVGANANNLKSISLDIPSGGLTVITGVSGSGKTSLLDRVIRASHRAGHPVNCLSICGFENFSECMYIGQPLPGTGYASTVGSFLELDETVARIFAAEPAARQSSLKIAHFLPGSREGRCPVCEGSGATVVNLDLFSDSVTPCERCGGTGYRDESLAIRVDDRTVADVRQLPFADWSRWVDEQHPKGAGERKKLRDLVEKTGLGHLSAARTMATLSTGELQRLKLVSGLASRRSPQTLILLDEPTGGLHPKDIRNLLKLFHEEVQEGNTLLCVTHDPIVIASAMKVIELGPGGGRNGGEVIRRDI